MKITLKRKADPTDKDPLIVQYLEGPEGKQVKRSMAVKVGETLEIDDDLAIEIMNKYRGLFAMGEGGAQYATKGRPTGIQAKVPTAAEA